MSSGTAIEMLIAQMCFFQSYPERFYFEGLLESAGASVPTVQYLPIYFGNVCMRFLPVSVEAPLIKAALIQAICDTIFDEICASI